MHMTLYISRNFFKFAVSQVRMPRRLSGVWARVSMFCMLVGQCKHAGRLRADVCASLGLIEHMIMKTQTYIGGNLVHDLVVHMYWPVSSWVKTLGSPLDMAGPNLAPDFGQTEVL